MKTMFRWLGVAAFTLALAPTAEAGLILDVTSDTQVFAPGVFHNIGWQFTVNAPITVDGLGVFDVNAPGLAERHQVGLWDNGGTLLAQTTVHSLSALTPSVSNAGDWLFEDIAPIVLQPGTYITSAFYPTSADSVIGNATIATTPQISFLASRASSEIVFAQAGVYGLVEPGVFAANLRFRDVPEPASLLVIGSGFAALGIRRRRSLK